MEDKDMYMSEKCSLRSPAQSLLVDAAKYSEGPCRLVGYMRMSPLPAGLVEAATFPPYPKTMGGNNS